jgi:hypothetical protein
MARFLGFTLGDGTRRINLVVILALIGSLLLGFGLVDHASARACSAAARPPVDEGSLILFRATASCTGTGNESLVLRVEAWHYWKYFPDDFAGDNSAASTSFSWSVDYRTCVSGGYYTKGFVDGTSATSNVAGMTC